MIIAESRRCNTWSQRGSNKEVECIPRTAFASLQSAAQDGPIILFDVNAQRSDAVIVTHSGDPILVPLPAATPETILAISLAFTSSMPGLSEMEAETKLQDALRDVWGVFVHPVVEILEERLMIPHRGRIWWCPGSRLSSIPFHACGPYRSGQRNLQDRFTSSYTPSIGTLRRLRKEAESASTGEAMNPRVLIVAHTEAKDKASLEQVGTEVWKVLGAIESAAVLNGTACTKDAVLSALETATWAHLCCRAYQDHTAAFNSRFALKDSLTLHDIAHASLPQAELAFLSACHTAAGGEYAPDEGMHLAAGMLFAGFRSVVGTMWACEDEDGPLVAEVFYEYMMRNGIEKADYRDSAEGLSKAVGELRKRKVPLQRWICYVHYGL